MKEIPQLTNAQLLQSRKNGFHVETYGGGRYTSIAWFYKLEEARAEVNRIKMIGAWSGMPPRIIYYSLGMKGYYVRPND